MQCFPLVNLYVIFDFVRGNARSFPLLILSSNAQTSKELGMAIRWLPFIAVRLNIPAARAIIPRGS